VDLQGKSFTVSGLENRSGQSIIIGTAVPIGTRGLYIQFNEIPQIGTWTLEIPNKRSALYPTYFNAYESAKATRDRVIADAQLANDALISRINKRKIYAPFNGVVATVSLKPGQTTTSAVASDQYRFTNHPYSENDYEVSLKNS
jgi:hypothetical protein